MSTRWRVAARMCVIVLLHDCVEERENLRERRGKESADYLKVSAAVSAAPEPEPARSSSEEVAAAAAAADWRSCSIQSSPFLV